ncbi:MAG: dihydroorotase [Clostridia bacterium]|nr:dihydroorotase [Clostridia bacterium]
MKSLNAKIYGINAGKEYISSVTGSLSGVFSDFNSSEYAVFPGFCDVHVHFRQPGFCYKETIKSGSMASAAGGYTAVCTMPNLKPVPDSLDNLKEQLEFIEKDAVIKVLPYGSITKGELGDELSDMEDMAPFVCGFSDDGRGVQSDDMMEKAMLKAKSLGKMIVAHCEVNSLLNGGYIHDGEYAKKNNHRGICSASEYEQIARDIELVKKTGVKYHVCHISTKESVELIRQAKKNGVDITCETGPHYLILDDMDLKEEGRFKMNPPLRSKEDKEALIEGIKDGTIDMIATDHAPHSAEEKSKGLEKSAFGIVGIETAFSLLYTHLVKKGIITLEKLTELMCINPRMRFGIPFDNSFTVFNLEETYTVNPDEFLSMGKATPFEGDTLSGRCVLTVYNNQVQYRRN